MSELQKLQRFFCKAMSEGWASGNDGEPSKEVPGWTEIRFSGTLTGYPGLCLVDRWGTDRALGRPSGHTIIFEKDAPVWVMHYGIGSYESKALPVLKAALLKAYTQNFFNGGRGVKKFELGDFTYYNEVEGAGFAKFSGKEWVWGSNDEELGTHDYWGGSLVYLS